jgi:glycosyltransferase involved in cell wall biosynthesis
MPNGGTPPGQDSPLLLIPVFNEWDVAARLLAAIDAVLAEHGLKAGVVLVDDGSSVGHEEALCAPELRAVRSLRVLELRRNLGHQRAIAIGLAYVHESFAGRAVLVMDGDGEDDPRDIPRLLERLRENGGRRIVFAARQRRSESFLFRFFYLLYVLLHRGLTGRGIRFGNFSVIPPRALDRLVVTSETWNHYAAAVVNSRIEYETIPTHRAPRLGGRSTMSFTALVVHGLSALSVYSHVIGVRLLMAAVALTLLLGAGLAVAAVGVVSAEATVSVWLDPLVLLLAVLLQLIVAMAMFVFLMLAGRQGASFLPARDYGYFVARCADLR